MCERSSSPASPCTTRCRRSSCCIPKRRRRKHRQAVKLKSVEFAGAIARPGQAPPGTLPQVAFAGRSNVGKSSLINRVLERHRKQIARVSASPGKTQEINFYRIRAELDGADDDFFLVDLPGYGFARAPRPVREAWRPLIEGFLRGTDELLGVVQLIDARHEPTPDDLRMIEFLSGIEMPTLIVLTKIDKLKPAEREKRLESATALLRIDADQVIGFSSTTGEGRDALMESLEHLLTGD
ncbi:MAG: YihA family ribosome biogenesis GTP-binding protein [Gemmatimonadetes bacterium]|nr:YihA family ribosome biogenesis GTP-binding protein [Gemmatimonadota bacterium]